MRRNLVPLSLLVILAVIAAACSDDDSSTSPGNGELATNDNGEIVIEVDGDEIVLTSGLSGFDDCDTLLDHLRSAAADRVSMVTALLLAL